jgi:hypothetical protein
MKKYRPERLSVFLHPQIVPSPKTPHISDATMTVTPKTWLEIE